MTFSAFFPEDLAVQQGGPANCLVASSLLNPALQFLTPRSLYLLLSLGLLLTQSPVSAQSFSYAPQSPNVMALGRFGEHPANLFTGVPSISIPIHEVSAGSLKLPISLDYHAGGNRVNDMASWVGMGWALNAGGSITRAKVGVEDENTSAGILAIPLNLTLTNSGPNVPECERRIAVYTEYFSGQRDSGYDIFSFSLPGGKSGKFILKPDTSVSPVSQVTLMIKERIRVSYTTNPLSFTIVDEEGSSYLFGTSETVIPRFQTTNLPAFPSAWYLTEMRGIRPTERIQFTYSSATFDGYADRSDKLRVETDIQGPCASGLLL